MKYDYFYLKELYSKDEIHQFNLLLENIENHGDDLPADNVIKTADVKIVPMYSISGAMNKLNQHISNINAIIFGFHLFETHNLEMINYNVYDSATQGQYDWHTDAAKGEINDIKLTAILNLSEEEYEGGHFELFTNGPVRITEIDTPGNVLIFPSFIPHRVTPVTKGKRITLSRWIVGPNWK